LDITSSLAQFIQSQKNVANYLQQSLAVEGYLVAEMVQTRPKQTIKLLPLINPSMPDKDNLNIIRAEEVKSVTKR
jgi:hypothetical protein